MTDPAPTEPRAPLPRRLALVGLGVVLAFVLLEIGLQVAAFTAWRSTRTADRPSGRVVLCIGDSFTFGLGAIDPETESYPAHLQRLLDASAPGTWSVVKAARPGRTSGEAVERLPDQLATYRPEKVLILIGANDEWHLQEAVAQMPAASGELEPFEWRCRTLRLFEVLLAPKAPAARPDATAASTGFDPARVVGIWHAGPARADFHADGSIVTDLGNFRWHPSEARVEIASNVESSFFRMHLDGDTLELVAEVGQNRLTLLRGEPTARVTDFASAKDAFHAARSPITAEPLLAAADAAGDLPLCIEACVCLLGSSPMNSPAMHWFEKVSRDPARRRAAIDEFEREVDALPKQTPGLAGLLRCVAMFRRPDDPDARMRRLVTAWTLDHDEGDTLHAFHGDLERFTVERLHAAAAAANLPRADIAELERLLKEAASLPKRIEETLYQHLTLMIEAVRAAGAEPILLSYPEPRDAPDTVRSRIARNLGVRVIDVRPEFERLLKTTPRSDLFVPDGHSNGAGYLVIAKEVARALAHPNGG